MKGEIDKGRERQTNKEREIQIRRKTDKEGERETVW